MRARSKSRRQSEVRCDAQGTADQLVALVLLPRPVVVMSTQRRVLLWW